eukprot:m.495825 g.495825  ORF g.495825 m.495825 type:complete len:216 (+) comp21802_c2_seq21:103-750(+)
MDRALSASTFSPMFVAQSPGACDWPISSPQQSTFDATSEALQTELAYHRPAASTTINALTDDQDVVGASPCTLERMPLLQSSQSAPGPNPEDSSTCAPPEQSATGLVTNSVYPTGLVLAVCVDALVDGFLIGISSAAGHANAGVVMTAALSIEMGFLGMTYSTALCKQALSTRLLSILLPPVALNEACHACSGLRMPCVFGAASEASLMCAVKTG